MSLYLIDQLEKHDGITPLFSEKKYICNIVILNGNRKFYVLLNQFCLLTVFNFTVTVFNLGCTSGDDNTKSRRNARFHGCTGSELITNHSSIKLIT